MIEFNSTTWMDANTQPPLHPPPPAQRYPIQEAQLEVWLSSQQNDQANCAYNEIATIEFNGLLDQAALRSAMQKLFRKHGSLRATFDRDGAYVTEHLDLDLSMDVLDWSTFDTVEQNRRHQEMIAQLGATPFNLERGPLFRAILQRRSETQYFLTMVAHHLVLDGWSLGVIFRELGQLYDAFQARGSSRLSETLSDQNPPSYRDFADAMHRHGQSQAGQDDLAYWINQFADGVPTLELPITGKRAPLRTYDAGRLDHRLPPELTAGLSRLAAKHQCSLYNTVLAAFQAFIARLCQTSDIVLAVPTAGQQAMDFPELVGQCVNTLPLRIQIDTQTRFADFLKQSRSVLLDAIEHQRFSFGTLLKHLPTPRDPSRPPLCSILFNLDPMIDQRDAGFGGLDVEVRVEPRTHENFEWFVNGTIRTDKSIELQVQYNQQLFQTDYIEAYFTGFQAFLEFITCHPECRLLEAPMMSLEQRQKLIVQANQTQMDYPRTSNLAREFTKQATETPRRIAVRCSEHQLTYGQLEEQSNRFATFLAGQGIGSGNLVGICTLRNCNLLVQLLGILKVGAGYVPLDPKYPTDRLKYMCEDSGLKFVIADQALGNVVETFGKPIVWFDRFLELAHIDANGPRTGPTAAEGSNPDIHPSDVCYVIYTSGSTGNPKGVMVPHSSVVNFLYSMCDHPGYHSRETVLAITTLSFDIAVLELYLPLLFGGSVFIADWETAGDGKKLIEAVDSQDIRLMQATPATWRMMIDSGWQGKRDLKALCGGEPLPNDLAGQLLTRCGQLWNLYGPTETTVWSSVCQISSPQEPICIGRPIGNTQFYLLDADGQEVPWGVEGELMIGGAGVTLGYRNLPDLTAERFIDNPYFNPFEDYVNHRLYKTGDIACCGIDGNVQYRRRNDKQIKLRGFRIELGEIETAIRKFRDVDQAVVVVHNAGSPDQTNSARLVAYLTGLSSDELIEPLRATLQKMLPHYMIPQNFVLLESLPLTHNDKVDLKSLPSPLDQVSCTTGAACESESEKYLAAIWMQILGISEVSRDDNFFNIGGHSLLVMQVINRVENEVGLRLSPQEFMLGSLEQLATQLESLLTDEAHSLPDALNQQTTTPPKPDSTICMPVGSAAASTTRVNAPSPFDRLRGFWRSSNET